MNDYEHAVPNDRTRSKFASMKFGIAIGVLLGITFGVIYVYAFHESSSLFYPFAGLVLLGGPLTGGIVSRTTRRRAFLFTAGIVFAILIVLSVLSYAVLPVFLFNSSQIPASCMNSTSNLASNLNYTVSGFGTGVLLASDARSAVVVMVDLDNLAFNSTMVLVNRSSDKVVMSMKFGNDILSAGISGGVLYLYNDKIGYFLNSLNGEPVRNVFTIDNYRGLYTSNNAKYVQTDLEISALNVNGSVLSHLRLDLKGIAFGCFIP